MPENPQKLGVDTQNEPGWNEDYPAIHIITISELLNGSKIKMTPQYGTFKQAQRAGRSSDMVQTGMFDAEAVD